MKARTVYLCDEASEALRTWLELRKAISTTHDALFVVEDKRRFGETTLAHMLDEVKAIAGMKDVPRIQPHSIRHAAATRLMRNGADLKSIQQWLAHTQLQTTAVYLHTDEQQARKIAPLAGLKASEETPASPQDPKGRSPYQWRRRANR